MSHYRSVQERPKQHAEWAVAMAISGGGSRSANFAMGAMLALEAIQTSDSTTLLDEVDYFSTSSGGGFAAGAYLAARFEEAKYTRDSTWNLPTYYEAVIRPSLKRSYINPLIGAWTNPRVWFSHVDEGDALEKAIDYHILGYKYRRYRFGRKGNRSLLLGDIFIDKDSSQVPRFPMLVANGTIYQNMSIFPFAPNILDTFQISGYTHHMRERHGIMQMDPYSLPVSVGLKASGSFPVLISNTTLVSNYDPGYPYLHIMDGGVADNIGYKTAVAILQQDTVAKKKFLLIVDADGTGIVPTFGKYENGVFNLIVAFKLPTSGLDSRRAMRKQDITELCLKNDITPVFLNFGAFIEDNPAPAQELIRVKRARRAMINRLADEPDDVTNAELQTLYDLVSDIRTKYTIKRDEQRLLTLAGEQVVRLRKAQLDQMFELKSSSLAPGGFKPKDEERNH
ncbi:MAG: patatin-like phospholipase family protein [Bacteroidota bacterium]